MSAWINAILSAQPFPGACSRMVMCTPELAAMMLELNKRNRKLSESVVGKYVAEIEFGEWYASSAGVGVSEEGILLDGQHRLAAVVKSEKTVPLLFVWNLPAMAQQKIDRQKKRSLFDVFTLSGVDGIADGWNSRIGVQAAAVICMHRRGFGTVTTGSLSDAEVKACFVSMGAELMFATKKLCSNPFKSAPYVAAAALMAGSDAEAAEKFWEKVVRPTELSADDARYRLSRWIIENTGLGGGGDVQKVRLSACFYAINKFLAGEKCFSIGKSEVLKMKKK